LAAMPSPARPLLGGRDPELARITRTGGLQAVVVRRVRRLEGDEAIACGLGVGRQLHDQNSERAAAPAAETSGAGTMPNRTTKMLLTASTSFTPTGMAS
jgi:hypothetical protein